MRPFAFLVILMATAACSAFCQSQTIDFHQFAGPTEFSNVGAPLEVGGVTISGGQILTNATNLPVNQSTVYGTADFCSGCLPTLTLDFATAVSGFSMFVMNGNTITVTYTVGDDQGGTSTITLVANFLSGAGTVALPEKNIRQVNISAGPAVGSCCAWDFFIDYITFTPSAPVLVDPVSVPTLMSGGAITKNTDLLATEGTVVQNVAADGVTQVVVRIPAGTLGQTLNVAMTPSVSEAEDGAIAPVGQAFGIGPVTITAISTPAGPMAFLFYRAPLNFSTAGGDDQASTRTVSLEIHATDNSGFNTSASITVLRPPVVLIHGIWGSSQDWASLTALGGDPRFFVRTVDYSYVLTGITSTSPMYNSTQLAQAKVNALGFAYNAPSVLEQVNQYILEFKTANNAAAIQADIVAHSMGGDITRTLRSLPSFVNSYNFEAGVVHKLITIDTPHLGTPLATDLLDASNECVASLLADNGHPSFSTVTFGVLTVKGATGDLQGDGTGGGLSPALAALQSLFVIPFPTALIAGSMTSTNLSGVDCIFGAPYGICAAQYIRTHCSNAPLATDLSSKGWAMALGGASDAVVPVSSQLNNTSPTSDAMEISGVIHSIGMERLSFRGPSVLDSASGIASQIIVLLNEITAGTDFHSL